MNKLQFKAVSFLVNTTPLSFNEINVSDIEKE